MKIGILTHHYVNNYGAFLQAYALREALIGEYPNDTVEIIDYINVKQYVINTCGWFRFYKECENLKCWLEKIRIPVTFSRERKQNMHLSPRCYTVKQVSRLNYDVIIVGSDEVWNYQDWKSIAPIKFGQGLNCLCIISYAPSVGNSEGNVPEYVTEGLKRFAALSARDSKTAELAGEIVGKTVPQVLDPTFLIDFPVKKMKDLCKPYVLFYYCDHLPVKIRNQIIDHAHSLGMAVYGAGECNISYDAVTVDLTPFEWVEMFRNASFVFTGTFHGVVFSIINRKPFKVYLTNKSRIQKVSDLLKTLQIENREISEGFEFDYALMKDEIDYFITAQVIETKKERSLKYLKEAVCCIEKND